MFGLLVKRIVGKMILKFSCSGIVLWELFSLGKTPYPGIDAGERFYDMLLKNYRMPQPDFAPREIYKLMLDCWAMEPTHRPRFRELVDVFGDLLGEGERDHYMVLSQQFDMDKKSELLEIMAALDYQVGGWLDR